MNLIFDKEQGAVEAEAEAKAEIGNIYAIGFDFATIGFICNKQLKNHLNINSI